MAEMERDERGWGERGGERDQKDADRATGKLRTKMEVYQ